MGLVWPLPQDLRQSKEQLRRMLYLFITIGVTACGPMIIYSFDFNVIGKLLDDLVRV